MQIDWQTVVFQTVNFLIIVFILKKFAFDKILKAIKDRQERISSQFEEAEQKRLEAEKEAESYRKKIPGRICSNRQGTMQKNTGRN